MSKITIKEIAREAGVSIATVSNVINKKPNKVSEAKKKAILEIMEKYNYSPNLNARSLVSSQSKMIGILYYSLKEEIDFGDPFVADLLTGVEYMAKKQGNYILFHGFSDLNDIDSIQKNWKFDGFIVIGAFKNIIIEALNRIKTPIVFIDSYYDKPVERKNAIFINNNDRDLSNQATKYLLDHGHRKIAFWAPKFSLNEDGVVPQRYLGYTDALKEKNTIFDSSLVFSENELNKFIDARDAYTAAIINSDYLAAKYLSDVRNLKASFKSIISFDNTIFSKLLLPPLTTFELKQREKGRMAVNLINDMLQASEAELEKNVVVEGEFVERSSVKSI